MSNKEITSDICVIGAGLVGKTAALKLAQNGSTVTLCAPKTVSPDTRTTALLMETVRFFEELGLWEKISQNAFPLKVMRIVDGSNRLIRTPQTDFKSSEIDLEAFGYNLKNEDILAALDEAISALPNISQIEGSVTDINSQDSTESIHMETDDGMKTVITSFAVGADGRNSILRTSKSVSAREWEYPQAAIVVNFKHEKSTQFTSTEFHTETGPFTIVPHSDHDAGLVWMETPENVEQLLSLSNPEFAKTMEVKMQSFLGKITLQNSPKSFPMKGLVANQFGNENWALIGEAAHVFPPIGAQGFNLGVRDIEALAETLSRNTNQENRGLHYNRSRKVDINTRTYGVDMLNRSLLSDFLPVQMARGIGLHLLGSIKPLRKYVMKMGIAPNI
jgi:2-octaprenyl-6-methoxyphenol hydroxylase